MLFDGLQTQPGLPAMTAPIIGHQHRAAAVRLHFQQLNRLIAALDGSSGSDLARFPSGRVIFADFSPNQPQPIDFRAFNID